MSLSTRNDSRTILEPHVWIGSFGGSCNLKITSATGGVIARLGGKTRNELKRAGQRGAGSSMQTIDGRKAGTRDVMCAGCVGVLPI